MVALGIIAVLLTFSLAEIASAQGLSNHSKPGSLLVFQKFTRGVTPTSGLARSVFEIGVVCPDELLTNFGHGCNLAQNTPIKIALDWVCPGSVQKGASSFCQSVDFELHSTLYGKLQFDANGNVTVAPDSGDIGDNVITEPSCAQGYLLARVVDNFGRAISFNGLVGESVLRERANSASALAAVSFQSPQAPFVLTDINANGALDFDGVEYLSTTGRIAGDVKYERTAAPTVITSIITLTLDVRQNNDNPNIRMPVRFYTADERPTSTNIHWTCWREQRLTALDGGPLNQTRMGEKGVVASTQGASVASACSGSTGNPCAADGTPVSVIAFIQTIERGGQSEYSYPLYGQGSAIPTIFFPF
jgi:hypothetical protein